MEQLIVLAVIIGASLLHSWWKKKQDESEGESESGRPRPPQRRPGAPAGGPPASPPSPAANWEEELRRLLQGEGAPRPIPPVVVQAPPPLPPVAVSRPVPLQIPTPLSQSDPDMDRGLSTRMATLEHSAQVFLRASQLESKVAEHMQRAHQQVASHKKIELRKEVAPEIRQALNLVRHRQSQRAAIIAGIVLGPAKAMEG